MTPAASTQQRPAQLRRALLALCLLELTCWGALYYALPVMAPVIADRQHWSPTLVTGGLSLALAVSAVAGVRVGRVLDTRGPRPVMAAGLFAAVAGLVGLATAPAIGWFLAAWVVVGFGMSAVLYQPAFAAAVGWFDDPVRPLLAITLVAGLASTVFAPLTSVLVAALPWRTVWWLLAGLVAVIGAPAVVWGLQLPWPQRGPRRREPIATLTRDRAFWQLAVSLAAMTFALYAVLIGLVPLLTGRGMSAATAAWAIGVGGLGQVAGRALYPAMTRRWRERALLAVVAAVAVVGLIALAALGVGPVVALTAAAVVGVARGLMTLIQATVVRSRWEPQRYGAVSGALAAPSTLTIAAAPLLGTVAGEVLGYPALFVGLGLLAAVAGIGLVMAPDPDPDAGLATDPS